MDKIQKKRENEQRVVKCMVQLYCSKNHSCEKQDGLCGECRELVEYASARSERCPFMEKKTFCANCKIHCYQPEMRERIRTVMRYSGPRMLLYHPILAIWHLICSIKEKKRVA